MRETPERDTLAAAAPFDVLDLLDSMATLFKEKRDTLLGWPWKFFCAYWIRLIRHTHDEREAEEQRERERAAAEEKRREEREWRDLERAHQQHWGTG